MAELERLTSITIALHNESERLTNLRASHGGHLLPIQTAAVMTKWNKWDRRTRTHATKFLRELLGRKHPDVRLLSDNPADIMTRS